MTYEANPDGFLGVIVREGDTLTVRAYRPAALPSPQAALHRQADIRPGRKSLLSGVPKPRVHTSLGPGPLVGVGSLSNARGGPMNEPQYIWTDIREGLTIADYRRARRKRRSTPYRLPGAPWLIVGNTTPRRIAMP